MRGELNIRNEYRNALNRAGLDITAPSTPGTASSMRTNPPSYQRMHSNDSNKGNNDSKDGTSNGRISDWLDHPSTVHAPGPAAGNKYLNVSNRFRRASNPSLVKHPLTSAQRQSGASSPLRQNYRHPPAARSRHLIGNSALPPLPPSINTRSQSLDGFLESNEKSQWTTPNNTVVTAAQGLNKVQFNDDMNTMTEPMNQSDGGSRDTIRNTTNRRSKSLDDLIDEDQLLIVEDERETQSMENILETSDTKMEDTLSPASSEKMCENEVMLVENSMSIPNKDHNASQNDSGIHCEMQKNPSDGTFDDDTISNTSFASSTLSADKKSGKTFFNKYVKKVKNLIKK